MIEGSGSKLLTNGSGSGKPKNMWIRWIRIRIRIRNTACNSEIVECGLSCVILVYPLRLFLLKRVSSSSLFLTEDLFQLTAPFLNMAFFSACTWLHNIIYVGLMSVLGTRRFYCWMMTPFQVFFSLHMANIFILSHPPVIGRKYLIEQGLCNRPLPRSIAILTPDL
jgi:hypothetical protein